MNESKNPMLTPEKAFEMYRTLVEDNEQALPLLAYGTKDETVALGIALEGMPEGGMQQVVCWVLNEAAEKIGSPQWIIFHSEGWYQRLENPEERSSMEPWELSKRVEAGEDMAECVMITGVSMAESWSYIVPFVRSGNTVVWDDPSLVPAEGGMPDLLRQAVR